MVNYFKDSPILWDDLKYPYIKGKVILPVGIKIDGDVACGVIDFEECENVNIIGFSPKQSYNYLKNLIVKAKEINDRETLLFETIFEEEEGDDFLSKFLTLSGEVTRRCTLFKNACLKSISQYNENSSVIQKDMVYFISGLGKVYEESSEGMRVTIMDALRNIISRSRETNIHIVVDIGIPDDKYAISTSAVFSETIALFNNKDIAVNISNCRGTVENIRIPTE